MEGNNPQPDLVGTVVDGKYEILRLIGKGGMGTVYAARQIQLDRQVALKLLRPELLSDNQSVARFTREAKASARLEHPNAVRVYDFGALEGGAYIAMEYLEGVSLRTMMRRSKFLDLATIVEIVWQAASAVAAAHALGVAHRDLKPENLIVRVANDGALTVKVLDFGLAQMLSGESTLLTNPTEMMGTPKYMAPEQFGDEPTDERVDVYALGVILYELVAGRAPFDGTFGEIVGKHLYATPPSFDALGVELPEWLERIVDAALVKSPAERIPSAAELARRLARGANGDEAVGTSVLRDATVTTSLAPHPTRVEELAPDEYRTEVASRDEITQIRRAAQAIDTSHEADPGISLSDLPTYKGERSLDVPTVRVASGMRRWWPIAVVSAIVLALATTLAVWMAPRSSEQPSAAAPARPAEPEAASSDAPAEEANPVDEFDDVPDANGEDRSAPPSRPSTSAFERAPGRIGDAPLFRNGAVIFVAEAGRGAKARRAELEILLRDGRPGERFPLVLNSQGTRWVVPPGARSKPGGLAVDDVVQPGALFQYRVRNADGTLTPNVIVSRTRE